MFSKKEFANDSKLLAGTISCSSELNMENVYKLSAWPRGYKTFFKLNSAEHEIFPANKSQITNNCKFFLAKHS